MPETANAKGRLGYFFISPAFCHPPAPVGYPI